MFGELHRLWPCSSLGSTPIAAHFSLVNNFHNQVGLSDRFSHPHSFIWPVWGVVDA